MYQIGTPEKRVIQGGMRGKTYLSKVDLIEDDLIGMPNAPESRYECKGCYHYQSDFVVPFGTDTRGWLLQVQEAIYTAVPGWRGCRRCLLDIGPASLSDRIRYSRHSACFNVCGRAAACHVS